MKIICIGRNYAKHIEELANERPDNPVVFLKPDSAILPNKNPFFIPTFSNDVHYEVEVIVALKSGGSNITEENAYEHIYGFGIGFDMTRRDLQGVCKKMGRPWEIGKAFERSAPMGKITPISEVGNMEKGNIKLSVNGETRQDGDLDMMIWKIPEQIAHLSKYYDISAGDLIMTGTPAGVGPIVKGDKLVGAIDGLETLSVEVI